MSRPPRTSLRDPNPKLNEVKLQLCRHLQRVAGRNGWTVTEMAIYCGTSRTCASLVINNQITKLTISQLFRYLARVKPHFEILISI